MVESTRKDPGDSANCPRAWPDWLESNMTTLLDLNPPCVNVEHLFLGTHQDNMLDKERKGRGRNQYHGATHCKRGHPRVPTEIQCLACRRVTAEIRRANGGKW